MLPATTAQPVTAQPIDPILSLITGGLNLGTASSDLGYGKEAAGMADPWSGQRGQYQTALNTWMGNDANSPNAAIQPLLNLIKDPSSVTSMPGYQFGMDQALGAVNRGAGASGLLNSGNRLLALQDQGQRFAGTWLDRMYQMLMGGAQAGLQSQGQGFNQLAQLAGVNAGSPAAAGNLFMNGVAGRDASLTGGVGGLATGLLGLLSGQGIGGGFLSSLFKGIGGGSGGLSGGGINAGTLDPGGSLGDLQSGDFGGGGTGDFFTGGDGNMFQIIDPIGG